MKNSHGSKVRTTHYHLGDLGAYAVAFYYLEVFNELTNYTSSALYAKDVTLLHYRDTSKQIMCPAPYTIYQKAVRMNNEVVLSFEQFRYPTNTQGMHKFAFSKWLAIMATVLHDQREIQVHCAPDFETQHITMPAQVGQWLIRNRNIRSKKIFPALKEILMPTRVLSPYQKAWEQCIQGAIIDQMM